MIRLVSLLRLAGLAAVAALPLAAANTPPEIRNLKVQQRPGTYLVDVTFDLVDPDSYNGVFLGMEASVDNGATFNLPAKTATGDLGLVKPGTGKKVVWDAFTDWPDKYTPNAKVRIVAADSLPMGPGRGPDGFVWIPPGKFMMGSPENEAERESDEAQYEVALSNGFWMCDHEVTQEEYEKVVGSNPSPVRGVNFPVDHVSWDDAVAYCKKLTELERAAGRITEKQAYRLPTEAEWEYAARAGTTGSRYGDLDLIAWWSGNSRGQHNPAKQKLPNGWGLYDMLGSLWEWCSDWYGLYPTGFIGNPAGPAEPIRGTLRVLRGGTWYYGSNHVRCADRYWAPPTQAHITVGFRIVLSLLK
jgi:formylglycine-generating enzyme required for sulfatase activity